MLRTALLIVMALSTASRAEVRLERATPRAGGQGVRYQQTWRGLDVIGGGVYVRFDERGLVRWSAGAHAAIPDDLEDAPLVDPAEAVQRLGRGSFPEAAEHARLVVSAIPGEETRLAWEVLLPRDLERMETLRGYVDAHTGELLYTENLVRRNKQARVFPTNPEASSLTTVTLDVPDGAEALANADIVALNCVDRSTCPLVLSPTQNARWCETVPLAAADGSGDFFYDRPADDAALEDEFSEVQMYFHATRGLAHFRELGFTSLSSSPMQAIVNLRVPEKVSVCTGGSSTVALEPHENAFFAPRGAYIANVFPEGDAMVFGQGEEVDYAYDGDVIYHELTHAVMSTLTPLRTHALDDRGLDATMFGMHEGFADMFAAIIAGDPEIGEYVGPAINGEDGPLRSLVNTRKCPDHLVGEEHLDGEIWAGALWELRVALPEAQRPGYDRALLTVVDSLGVAESFDTVQARIATELETSVGADAAATARQVFADRGLDGCNGRVVDLALGSPRQVILLTGTSDIPELDRVPAPVQLSFELREEATEIRVTIDVTGSASASGDGTPALGLLVKKDAPVTWSRSGSDDAPFRGEITVATAEPRRATGKVVGNFPPGKYYALLTNAGTSWVAVRTRFASDVEGPGSMPRKDDGCATGAVGGTETGPAALLILAGLLVLPAWRRARRRRDPRA